MARKSILKPYALFYQGDLSTTQISAVVNVENLDKIYIEYDYSANVGTSGQLVVQVATQDMDGNAGIWHDLSFEAPITIAAGSVDGFIQFSENPFQLMRVVYNELAAGASSGTFNIKIYGKVVGA